MNLLIWHGGVTVLALDNFVDANATPLQNHAMNVGSGWTLQGAGGTLASVFSGTVNEVLFDQNGVTGDRCLWTTPTTSANVSVFLSVNFPSPGQNAGSDAGIILRFQDANNYTLVIVGPDINGIGIYEKSGGSFTQRAFASLGTVQLETDYRLYTHVAGTSLTATVNGGNAISYGALAVNTGGTTHGMRYGAGTSSSFGYGKAFQVTT